MSTRVGTLQAPRAGGSILLAAFLASLVMLTIAVIAISVDRNEGRQGGTTFAGRHVVTTPSELSAGIVGGAETFVGGTAANTPTELSGGIRHKYVEGALGTDTPSELSGGLGNGIPAEIYDRHQRG
jgi:hypothetical protein